MATAIGNKLVVVFQKKAASSYLMLLAMQPAPSQQTPLIAVAAAAQPIADPTRLYCSETHRCAACIAAVVPLLLVQIQARNTSPGNNKQMAPANQSPQYRCVNPLGHFVIAAVHTPQNAA
jgi:hypothetical protein